MKTIDEYFNDIEKLNVKFRDKDKFMDFIFEYTYQTLNYYKKDKTDENIKIIISNKLNTIYLILFQYRRFDKYKDLLIEIQIPKYTNNLISKIIRYEEKEKVDGLFEQLKINYLKNKNG